MSKKADKKPQTPAGGTKQGQPPPMREHWRSRIVGEGELPAGDFLANEKNFRIHPQFQQEAVSGVLDEIGFIQRVIVNKRMHESWGADRYVETLIDGHLRVAEALKHGEDVKVPVLYVDLLPAEEAMALATLDPIAALAATDQEKLSSLLKETSTTDAGLDKLLKELADPSEAANRTKQSRESGTGRGLGSPVVSYQLIFDNQEQQDRWFDFCRQLKANGPESATVATLVDEFITPHLGNP